MNLKKTIVTGSITTIIEFLLCASGKIRIRTLLYMTPKLILKKMHSNISNYLARTLAY